MTAAAPPLNMPLASRLATKTAFRPGLLPVTLFVGIIAWALFSVLMLTGTITAANQINDRVGVINTVYPAINQNLRAVALAAKTGEIAGNIRDAAAPLSPQFTQIVHDVDGINGSVDSILADVNTIHGSVLSINQAVHDIHGSVLPIAAGLNSIDGKVGSIHSSVNQIDDRFSHIQDHVYSINDRLVHGSNDRIQAVIDQARGIHDDTDKLAKTLVPDILTNAHAIAGSPIIDPADTSRLDPRRFNPLLGGLAHPGQLPSLLGLAQAAHKPAVPTVPQAVVAKPLDKIVPPVPGSSLIAPFAGGPLGHSGHAGNPGQEEPAPSGKARSLLPLGGLSGRN